MIRITSISETLHFFCDLLGMQEIRRYENKRGRFTLIFLAASADAICAKERLSPLLELTWNWPDDEGNTEDYSGGRNFGHLAFRVDNIYDVCQRLLDGGVTINRPPRDGHMAFVKSPDDISIELLQKGDDLMPQEPWVSMKNTGSW